MCTLPVRSQGQVIRLPAVGMCARCGGVGIQAQLFMNLAELCQSRFAPALNQILQPGGFLMPGHVAHMLVDLHARVPSGPHGK